MAQFTLMERQIASTTEARGRWIEVQRGRVSVTFGGRHDGYILARGDWRPVDGPAED